MPFQRLAARMMVSAALLAIHIPASAQTAPATVSATEPLDRLRTEFAAPPTQARPWTWFHVMSGNMNREGITRDLEAIADAGIGGIVLFHVTQGISHGTVRFFSAEHRELITHVAAECERLGLAFLFHNSDGWSSSGGPWITPENSMMRLVWTEHQIAGGAISTALKHPPMREDFYRDVAVLAYPALPGELRDAALNPVITSSDPAFDTDSVADGDPNTVHTLNTSADGTAWIQFSYDTPVAISSIFLANSQSGRSTVSLQISDDGQTWRNVHEFRYLRVGKREEVVDEAFPAITAQHFRVVKDMSIDLGELTLSTLPRITRLTRHTSLAQGAGADLPLSLDSAAETLIDPSTIIDLTDSMQPDGQLSATLPDGDWTILRFGYTSTGAINVNGSPEGTGLEVDKFSASAFQAHYDGFIGPIIDDAREVAPTMLTGAMIDSYEVGGQNWTPGYDDLFAAQFDQPILQWLPAFAGRLVSSADETRDMLAQIRSFNADLMRDNYYGAFAALMAEQGLESPIQPYGNGPADDVDVGSVSSLPTGEFWMGREAGNLNDAISAGRLYGRRVIPAEAFTAMPQINWHFSPALGKRWGDRAWTMGINQFMFHRFAHQANTHVMPGMTMNRWGSHFDRTQPWWDQGGAAWFHYMARGHHMLQQGHAVAHIALFVGEDSPVACPEKPSIWPSLPAGVDFDCLNAESLFTRSRFVDGTLEMPDGRRYAMIWWPEDRPPSDAALARLRGAQAAGVPVAFGHEGDSPLTVFAEAGLTPQIASDGDLPLFTHRRTGETDIFFLLNLGDDPIDEVLYFDVGGAAPELWDPVTGQTSSLPAQIGDDGRTQVPMTLFGGQSAFIVFDPSNRLVAPEAQPDSPAESLPIEFALPWSVTFDPLFSDAGTIEMAQLTDLRLADDPEIQHFSGKVTYRNSFHWNTTHPADHGPVMLDLGQVEVAATVRLNGSEIGTVWTYPFALDIADALVEGENMLEIEVATLWVNRLIGDAALPDTSGYRPEGREPERDMVAWYSANLPPPPGPRRTFSTHSFFRADDPLVPSGLIGPLTVITPGATD